MMEIYLVGGAVRDQLLNIPFTEKDWVVVGSSPEEMLAQGYIPVGKDFPVFLHPNTHEEYALARTERKTAPGYKGFTFHTDASVSLEEDLQRRDLTINAIAQDQTGQIIDPYNGQRDIASKCLQHVSPTFSEDPVRVLRVARFSAKFHYLGFTIAETTMQLMRTMVSAGETKHLVAERVWQECQKSLGEKDPACFFRVLVQCGAIGDIFPQLSTHNIDLHIDTLEKFSREDTDKSHRFSALCFGLNKLAISQLVQSLAIPNNYKEIAILTQTNYLTITQHEVWQAEKLTSLFQHTDALRKPERFEQLLKVCEGLYSIIGKGKKERDASTKHQSIRHNLLDALEHYKNVDHQALIQQGYEKSALGEAIKEHRLQAMVHWLSGYQST